jgi:hypothetical protein
MVRPGFAGAGAMILTAPMRRFIDYFGDLGPRWGLGQSMCRVHALLFLAGRALRESEIATALQVPEVAARESLAELSQWRMARLLDNDDWETGGEPWDLLFTALQERRRREMEPALRTLLLCRDEMAISADTPPIARTRIDGLLAMMRDLAAIDLQASRVAPASLIRLVSLGGRVARLFGRISPTRQGKPP